MFNFIFSTIFLRGIINSCNYKVKILLKENKQTNKQNKTKTKTKKKKNKCSFRVAGRLLRFTTKAD